MSEDIEPATPSGPEIAAAIDAQIDHIAQLVTEAQFAADPSLRERFGDRGLRKCTEDCKRHLSYVSSAAAASSDALFTDYVGWAKVLLARLGLSDEDLSRNLILLRDAVRTSLGGDVGVSAARIIDSGLRKIPTLPSSPTSFFGDHEPHGGLAHRYLELLLTGDRRSASLLIHDAVNRGMSVRDIYLDVFQKTQYEIGRRWQMNEMTVAEEHFCTAATQVIMAQLYPRIFASARVDRRLVATCVGGDLHEIGVRMVADFFEMEGWDTYYLGANTPIEAILGAVEEQRADALAVSATMSYHVAEVENIVRAIRSDSGKRAPRILVGGYPFRVDPELWRRVGADGFAADASSAVSVANALVEHRAR